MRILHVVHQYPPDKVGGVELYTQAASRALAQRGHAVAVFYRRDIPGQGISHHAEEGVNVYAAWDGVAGPARRFLLNFNSRFLHKSFLQALDEFRPEVVHIQHLMGLPVSLVGEIGRHALPVVITLHDYWWVCANAQLLTTYSEEI
ncbi:MAG: glycosyltransferase, partial [Anaerolineae bacterium]